MTIWHILLGVAALLGGTAALYGLHRLCLWLEERGWLFYLHKKPSSSPASCFVAMQKALEPQTEHTRHVKEEQQHEGEKEPAGETNTSSLEEPS